MKIESSTVTKLLISGLERLDPISVFLEDFEPKRGKITVSCYGQNWSAFWGGMWEGLTVGQFFCELNDDYIIGYFASSLRKKRFSGDALKVLARKAVISRRRRLKDYWEYGDSIDDKDIARDLYDRIDELADVESITQANYHNELLSELFGEEWWHLVDGNAVEDNPDYDYLCRIIKAVQDALRSLEPETVPALTPEVGAAA